MPPPNNIPFVRTPESRFQNLPDFPYEPKYLQYGDLRMAYIDEYSPSSSPSGTATETFLLLHGEPTWSYLYRKMIPVFLNHTTTKTATPRRRVVCPDLFGFGRSDKPTQDADYTFHFHRDSLLNFIRELDLTNTTLVVQDWGGLLGLTLPVAEPGRFNRALVMNTMLATGNAPTDGFRAWRGYVRKNPDIAVGALLGRSCPFLSVDERRAYDAPYPGKEFKAGVRRFPDMVMVSDASSTEGVEVSRESVEFFKNGGLGKRAEDVVVACGMMDPVLGPQVMEPLSRMWGNGCFYVEVKDAGHFVQEWGGDVAAIAINVFEDANVEGARRVTPGGGGKL